MHLLRQPQAGLEHYEIAHVGVVEQSLAALMRRCAKLLEEAPPADEAEGATRNAANRAPSEPIIPKDWKLPRYAKRVSSAAWRFMLCLACSSLGTLTCVWW